MRLPVKLANQINIPEIENMQHIKLQAGQFFATDTPSVITTLLGSCVAACLYDPINHILGMNHFLLSNDRYSKNLPYYISEAGRYGINAMELLINQMLRLGAKKENLRAKAFGGANVLDIKNRQFSCVGDVNVRFIKSFLKNEQIPVVTTDLGGDEGRVIYFVSNDYSVYVRKIKKYATVTIEKDEMKYWKQKISDRKEKSRKPDLWQ